MSFLPLNGLSVFPLSRLSISRARSFLFRSLRRIPLLSSCSSSAAGNWRNGRETIQWPPMAERNFRQLLETQWEQGKFLCVGLDSDLDKIPQSAHIDGTRESIVYFNRAIVDATKDLVCSYKPNPAFYEAQGDEGWKALRETIQYIHEVAPDVAVILDAKRADIGNTNEAYAKSAFDHLHADA